MKKGDLINIQYGMEGNFCNVRIRSIEVKQGDETTYIVGIMQSNGHIDQIQIDYAEIIKVAVENEVKEKGCMKMTESRTVGVFKKLREVQCKLIAPKNQYNTFGKYKYRSCEDILEGVKPLLSEVGATLVISDKIVSIADRIYVEATATFTDEETCETISNTASAREPLSKKGMDDSQVTGATSSYARKYALNGLFCIDDTKDADTDQYANQTKSSENQQQNPPKQNTQQQAPPQNQEQEFSTEDRTISEPMYNTILKEMERTHVQESQLLVHVKSKNIKTMLVSEFNYIMQMFKATPTFHC